MTTKRFQCLFYITSTCIKIILHFFTCVKKCVCMAANYYIYAIYFCYFLVHLKSRVAKGDNLVNTGTGKGLNFFSYGGYFIVKNQRTQNKRVQWVSSILQKCKKHLLHHETLIMGCKIKLMIFYDVKIISMSCSKIHVKQLIERHEQRLYANVLSLKQKTIKFNILKTVDITYIYLT